MRYAYEHRACERQALHQRFQAKIAPHPALDRTLVSFQANKTTPIYQKRRKTSAFAELEEVAQHGKPEM